MKKLTVEQKKYLVKRIDSIFTRKQGTICKEYNTKCRTQQRPVVTSTTIDVEAARAIASGKVKLLSTKAIRQRFSDKAAIQERSCRGYSYNRPNIALRNFDVVDKESLAEFNRTRMDTAKVCYKERDERVAKLRKEATKLKDTIMLGDGAEAAGMLQRFEEMEF